MRNCSHLLTRDHQHFGELFGRSVEGVRILTVRDYLTVRGIVEDSLLDVGDE